MVTRDEQIQIPKLIDKLYSKEIVLDTIKKWNITGGGSFTDNEDMEANHGLSIYFGTVKVRLYFNFYEKRYEIARMEKYLLGRILGDFWYLESLWTPLFRSESSRYRGGIYQLCRPRRNRKRHHKQRNPKSMMELPALEPTNPDEKWQRLFGGVEPLKLSTNPQPTVLSERFAGWPIKLLTLLHLVTEADKSCKQNTWRRWFKIVVGDHWSRKSHVTTSQSQ